MRTPIPEDIASDVLFRHHHTCCVCNIERRSVQLHHIDDDNTNHAPENLAVLCLECHSDTQIRGGFGRKLRAQEVIKHRDDWVKRVAERKRRADEIIVEKMTTTPAVAAAPGEEAWDAPSERALAALVNSLPDALRAVYVQARPQWDSGVTVEMILGSHLVIDVLERAWLELAKSYPPRHFGNVTAEEFIRDYIGRRSEWNFAVQEPDGGGTGGREVFIIAQGSTANDIESLVADTVCHVGSCRITDFDFLAWRRRWEDAKRRPDEGWKERLLVRVKRMLEP